ncbi:MAG: chromosome segregation protein SMC [Verrucomicrobia bacterium]|nr:chromosome segregation protein SMC [Verrucomicrobiota bacterium]
MNKMRFARVELENWKNFTSVEVDLANRVFIVGPNAIGKSNFLQVFRFLRDLVLEGGGLGPAVNQRGGMGKVRSLYARGLNTDVMIRVVVKDEAGAGWRYELAFAHESDRNPRPVVVRELVDRLRVSGETERKLARPDNQDETDPERLKETAIGVLRANQDFRELADFFRTVAYLHLVPQLLREEQSPRGDTLGTDPYGRDLLDQIRNTTPRTQKARLRRLERVLKTVAPQLENLRLEIDEHGQPHLEGKFRHWRPQGAYQDERQLSDGTLRLIGLLWSLQEPGGPLLLEEPELSLHTAIVKRLAPFIHRAQVGGAGRQVILTTHSEHLLMDAGIAPEEVLLMLPAAEGAQVVEGAARSEIVRLMQAGLTASEAVLPRTETRQMALFDRLNV